MRTALRLYRRMLRLLPPSVPLRDREEMVLTLAEHLAAAPDPRAVAWRAIRRLPSVLVLEWRDALTAARRPSPSPPRRGSPMDGLARLIRYGIRSLLRTPAFSLSVVLLLGLGVGGVTAVFAVVDHVLLRPLPYPSPDRLFLVEHGSHTLGTFRELQAVPSVDAWAAASSGEGNLTGAGEPVRVRNAVVSDAFFRMFGAKPALGRLFQASDFVRPQAVVLSYGAWRRLFGSDSGVVGRTIRFNDGALTIIGVTEAGFAPPEALVDGAVSIWQPIDPAAAYFDDPNYYAFNVAGRLRPGVTLDQAQQDVARVAAERAQAYPDRYLHGGRPSPLPIRALGDATTRGVRAGLDLLFGAVALLLLLACANVTHLFLARSVARTREIAIRRALGSGMAPLLGQLLIESLLLSILGVAAGIALAEVGVRAFLALMPDGLPRAGAIALDGRVAGFAAGIGLLTAVVFGLLPALRFVRAPIADPIRTAGQGGAGGHGAHRLRSAIVIGEVALSLVLAAQAGWLLRSFIRMTDQDLGFRTDGVVTMPLVLGAEHDSTRWSARMDAVRESLARTRGVAGVTFGFTMPLEWVGGARCCWSARPGFAGRERPASPAAFHPVGGDYFRVLGIRLLAGAAWTRARARAKPGPVVINQQLARQVFGGPSAALGARLMIGRDEFQVTGVAANTRHYGADQDYGTAVYLPANTISYTPDRATIAVRTDRTDAGLARDLRAAVWSTEPHLSVPVVRSLGDWSRADAAQRRFDSLLFGALSTVALVLVAAGLAGTLLYMVSLQRRSLGIRLALGATPHRLERGVLANGLWLASGGVVIGAIGVWLSGRFIQSRLYGVDARDPRTLGLAVVVLMLVAVVSSWWPARRAANTDPMESLRSD